MTPLTEEILDVFEEYREEYNEIEHEHSFENLLEASRHGSALEIYNLYDENETVTASEIPKNVTHHRVTLYQNTLPNLSNVDLVEWSGSMSSEVTMKQPYGFVEEFLAEIESAIEK